MDWSSLSLTVSTSDVNLDLLESLLTSSKISTTLFGLSSRTLVRTRLRWSYLQIQMHSLMCDQNNSQHDINDSITEGHVSSLNCTDMKGVNTNGNYDDYFKTNKRIPSIKCI